MLISHARRLEISVTMPQCVPMLRIATAKAESQGFLEVQIHSYAGINVSILRLSSLRAE